MVGENDRTVATAEALAGGDVTEAGRLMAASHRSLADDYEVSGPALDAMVAVAAEAPGSHGARMTGGGFAGCAVALVDGERIDAFRRHVTDNYRAPSAQPATASTAIYPVRPSPGAGATPVESGP